MHIYNSRHRLMACTKVTLVLFVAFFLPGCQKEISKRSAEKIAYIELRNLFNKGAFGKHKLEDVKLKNVGSEGIYWSFTYQFTNNSDNEIVITTDHYGHIINVASWIDRSDELTNDKNE